MFGKPFSCCQISAEVLKTPLASRTSAGISISSSKGWGKIQAVEVCVMVVVCVWNDAWIYV